MEDKDFLCKVAKTCEYGCVTGGFHPICVYILKTGKSRLRDPEGEIVNGSCGLYKQRTRVRTVSQDW